jgi:hypothetical protein
MRSESMGMPQDRDAATRELSAAIEEYRRLSGRMFPTWSEVLEVIQGLGYQKSGDKASAPKSGPRFLIRIDSDPDDRAASAIRSWGGREADPADPRVYTFSTESARDAALNAVRRALGWTAVHPA